MQTKTQKFQPLIPILVLILVNCIIGLVTLHSYGESWDERGDIAYGHHSIENYVNLLQGKPVIDYNNPGHLDQKGPVFFMLADLTARVVARIAPNIQTVTVWHFLYFLSFQASVMLIYFLARRWVKNWAAFGTAFLFSTQPLLWGHAFINPKDTPFMAFFLASVTVGLYTMEAALPPASGPENVSTHPKLRGWAANLGSLRTEARSFFRELARVFISPGLLFAALLLGLTVSIRIIGPLAGLIIAIYSLGRSFKRSLPVLAGCAIIAIVVAFVTWPYLWAAPLERFLIAFRLMSQYTVKHDLVLFNGVFYAPNALPWYYLPVLIVIQLTEPVLVLVLAGLCLVIFQPGKYWTAQVAALGVWFLLPLTSAILAGSTLYDNFRQFLFILPALFILAGMALDELFSRINAAWLKAMVLGILVLPGILAGVSLHPYEYTYYNNLVGGTGGAFRRFETDYWGTSFTEAANYFNQTAPLQASVFVSGPYDVLRRYLRPDIKIITVENVHKPGGHYDYLMTLTRWNNDLVYCPQGKTIFTIERDKAIFTVIKQVSNNRAGCP